MNNTKIEISTWTILKFFIFILGLVFLYYIRSVVAVVFIVIILVAGFTPFVNWLVSYKIPRILAVVILYIGMLLFLSLIVYIVIPPLIEQISQLSFKLPYYTDKFSHLNINISSALFTGSDILNYSKNYLSQVSGGLYNSILSIFGSAASALTVFVLTFYILAETDSIEKFVLAIVPKEKKEHSLAIYNKISGKLGNWLRGQIVLALTIGVCSYIILSLLGIKYALSLAVLAGVLEIVPIIGPIVSGLIALVLAFLLGASWWQIAAIAISYAVIQQLESHFLVPKMMGKAVGLSPIIIIIALMIGGQLGGIIGAILAIPIAAGVSVIIQNWSNLKNIN